MLKNSNEKTKIILSCLSGNVLEWFDFAVYGYLAPVLATQFFPTSSLLASLLLTYSVFAIGFLFRPLGAIIFGHIGDTRGRKTALVFSSMAMAIPTFLIGILPNFESIGIAAPLLLITCRIFQGLSLGGEFTGSFVYLIEQGTPGKKGFFSCWADLGCYSGMLLGSLCIALLHTVFSPEQLAHFGWRLPFLSGILLSLLAIYIRSQLNESFEFTQTKKEKHKPLKQLFKHYPGTLFFSTLLVTINALGYYTLIVFMPNQTIVLGKLPASEVYLINTFVLLTILIATFIAASACDFVNKAKIYTIGIFGCMLFAYPAFYSLNHFSLSGQIAMMCLMGASLGFCFGPRPLFMASIFPTSLRFSGIAIALNIGNAIFGGTAPLVATYLVDKTGTIEVPAVLIIISSILTYIALLNLKKRDISEGSLTMDSFHLEKQRV